MDTDFMAPNQPVTQVITPAKDFNPGVNDTASFAGTVQNEQAKKTLSHRRQLNKVRRMLTQARKRGAAQIVTRYTRRGVAVY